MYTQQSVMVRSGFWVLRAVIVVVVDFLRFSLFHFACILIHCCCCCSWYFFFPFVRLYLSVSLLCQWREIKRIKNYPKAIVVSHNNRISQQHHCHHNHFIIHYHHRTSTQKFCFVWCLIEHEHVQCKRKRALFRRRQTLKIPRQKMRNTQQQTHTSIICVEARNFFFYNNNNNDEDEKPKYVCGIKSKLNPKKQQQQIYVFLLDMSIVYRSSIFIQKSVWYYNNNKSIDPSINVSRDYYCCCYYHHHHHSDIFFSIKRPEHEQHWNYVCAVNLLHIWRNEGKKNYNRPATTTPKKKEPNARTSSR